MSFLYPRTCTITRARAPEMLDVGDLGYSGHVVAPTFDPLLDQANIGITDQLNQPILSTLTTTGEVVIASGVPCSIQAKATGRATSGGLLPADAAGPVHWRIFFPKRALAKGTVRDRDIVIDDLGDRYQVSAAYWNSLGFMLDTIRLET